MKLTVRRSLSIAALLLAFLLVTTFALTLIPVDRRLTVPGSFVYRRVHPVVTEVEGFVAEAMAASDTRVEQGQPILKLQNDRLTNDMEAARGSLRILELELRRILASAGHDLSAERLDARGLSEELEYQRQRMAFLEKTLADTRVLAARDFASRNSLEEAELAYRGAASRVAELEIAVAKAESRLRELDEETRLDYELKSAEKELAELELADLRRQAELMIVRSPADGLLVAPAIEELTGTLLEEGTRIGEVVSEDQVYFRAYAGGAEVVRIREGQRVFFNVELFRRRQIVEGRVERVRAATASGGNTGSPGGPLFPVDIEVPDGRFFDRSRELYLQAGVPGEAVIVTEEAVPLARLLWERVIDRIDPY